MVSQRDLQAICKLLPKIVDITKTLKDKSIRKRFSDNVHLLAQARHMSLGELGELVGYPKKRKAQFSRLLRFARKPDLALLARIADAFGVSLNTLLFVDLGAQIEQCIAAAGQRESEEVLRELD